MNSIFYEKMTSFDRQSDKLTQIVCVVNEENKFERRSINTLTILTPNQFGV